MSVAREVGSAVRRPRAGRLLAAVALIFGIVAAVPQNAGAGEYVVEQCAAVHPGFEDARFDRTNGADYNFGKYCSDTTQGSSLQVANVTGAPFGREGRIGWLAPAGTRLIGASLEASLRSDAGHVAKLSFLGADGLPKGTLGEGRDRAGGFERFSARPGDRSGLIAVLGCEVRSGCPRSEQARTWVRELELTIRDDVTPTVLPRGSLLSGGWRQGSEDLGATLVDAGSGLRSVAVTVNGRPIGLGASWSCAASGELVAFRLQPCELRREIGASLATATPPFINGPNALRICARDFGRSARVGCAERTVMVDNAPPSAAFRGAPPHEDPELISGDVTDAHSGLALATITYRRLDGGPWRQLVSSDRPGELSARVDSGSVPAGDYLFRINAVDVAGNTTETTKRADGRPMILRFPLKPATTLAASLGAKREIGYDARPEIRGRLRGGDGEIPPGASVAVVERFDSGAARPVRVSRINVDRRGRFATRLGRGPSRRVSVAYGGSLRYEPSSRSAGGVRVRGRATLTVSRRRVAEGSRVRFRGRVGHRGARIPARGKLVELQVRARGERRFHTVREATRTDPNGQFRSRYSFGRFYTEPTRYAFRLKVTGETGWPYVTPAYSKPRRLTVVPR